MNKQGNTYTFIYSVVLVVIVATLLAIISLSLKPLQLKNINNEKRQNILSSVHINSSATESESLYNKYITDSYIINTKGEKIEGDAFKVNIASEYKKPIEDRKLPVFVADIDGKTKYVLPVYGAGLWGAIWGFVSFNDDKNTICGTVFDHESETPGLGAKITTANFQNEFKNKKIFENNTLKSVTVKKGGGAQGDYEVDAISGATITSRGVQSMLSNYLLSYKQFLNSK